MVRPTSELSSYLEERQVDIGILAVPPDAAGPIMDQLVAGGVRAILNYAPTTIAVPPGVEVKNIDPVLSLQSMTFFLKSTQQGR